MILQRLALRAAVACALLLAPASARAWEGRVSWYGSEHGQTKNAVACSRRTVGRLAGRFDPGGLTAAHRSLACGTRLRITDFSTSRSVDVTVNDWGPAAWTGRSLDITRAAADRLGMRARGVIRARITVLGPGLGRLHLAGRP